MTATYRPGFRPWAALMLGATVAVFPVLAEDRVDLDELGDDPFVPMLEKLPAEVLRYNEHLVFLSNSFCEGRVPGSHGMEVATQYMEYYFQQAGLLPPFDSVRTDRNGEEVVTKRASYRQPFPLGSNVEITGQYLAVNNGGTMTELEPDVDFAVQSIGASGDITGEAVFVGYSIEDGPEGFNSYAGEDVDLMDKIAVMFRFEPMNAEGRSLWHETRWSDAAGFNGKINAAVERGASAVVIVNPPNCWDTRAQQVSSGGAGRGGFDVPVVLVGTEAAADILPGLDPQGRSLQELRTYADNGGAPFTLGGRMTVRATIEEQPLMAENVGGLIPGKGDLADEFIVIGAHIDHLGMGNFGSRAPAEQRGTTLHPGADDNASGSAALLLLADRLSARYADLPSDAEARSILIIGFSGEESGLHGSRYYANNPIEDISTHTFMINFDMIGRIQNRRISISGVNTAEGLAEFVQPFFEESPLEEVVPEGINGASDHTSFMQKNVPILFAIIADFHGDYHTPDDVEWKINRVDAVRTVELFDNIAFAVATRPEAFVYAESSGDRAPRAERSAIRVRFGIMPGTYEEGVAGVVVGEVTEGGSAAQAGVLAGDRIVKWNGVDVTDIVVWMDMLRKANPGDEATVVVIRNGEEVTLKATLQAAGG